MNKEIQSLLNIKITEPLSRDLSKIPSHFCYGEEPIDIQESDVIKLKEFLERKSRENGFIFGEEE